MKLLEKILLATDFSKSSDNVVENAIVLAKTFNSKIILVHVLPIIKNIKTRTLVKETFLKQLDALNEKISKEGIKTDTPVLIFGNHFEKIVKTADRIKANTILIGAGEKTKDEVYQLGTTAEKIIKLSDRPVWVIKNDRILNVRNIICPVDFSQESERALKNAITIARRFKARLNISSVYDVSYYDPPSYIFNFDKEIELARSEHLEEFDLFLKKFNLTDLDWKKVIQIGDPAEEILKSIKRYKYDLLIMGTTGKSGLIKILMGSVTEKVVREVPCTFIMIKSEDIIYLKLESKIQDIESHFSIAKQLVEDGFYEESINEFKKCLIINDMHVPSINWIAKVYEKMGDIDISKKYKKVAHEVLVRLWNEKIENEVRKFHTY